jgi:hypothetical protein
VHAGGDLDGDDRGHDPVDDHAERRPPACVGDEVAAVLPEVLSPWPAMPATSSHGDPVTAAAATTTNAKATPLSTAITFARPSATAKPT